ncbi:pPIWI_RE module domain-containing protein [Nocardiopsis sp. L17-MgMaSL7]|uniref:pPIWI_RE module domain-containing protein n=1 Tax=Nocardiopsis sp. L17-MgMaSL7 TaxID=1938893 RepID=UPI000D835B67|nr:DUF3962 domain-containing protein [Nocardiopsis sp. L17-MgMaSL7]PWV54844.1 uncharacterized protein DUF3893 [Nocardiopsis sp. L17-MgMaSL7]
MSRNYKSITLTAYELPEGREINHRFHVLPMPEELRSAFHRFHHSRFADPNEQRFQSFPINRLNNVLTAAAPDVISVGRSVAVKDDSPWLYARGPVDLRLVRGVLGLWVRGMKGISSADLDPGEVFDLIDSTSLAWREQEVDLKEQVISPGGTAEPASSLYRLLPDFLARLIRLSGPFIGPSGRSHSFLESPGSARRSELVSWPPMTDQVGEAGARFSYVITISVQTVPFTPRFRVHVRTGVRRWTTDTGSGGTLYNGGRSVSVHLLTTSLWAGISGERSRLSVNRLRYYPSKGTHVWRLTDGPDLPSGASILPRLPEPRELINAPERWLSGVDGVVAAIPYNTRMGSHDVGAGLMAGERVPLMDWIDDALSPFLTRAPLCEQLSLPNHPSNFPSPPSVPAKESKEEKDRIRAEKVHEQKKQEVRERRDLLRNLLDGAPFVARVHWQETETRDALVSALRALLDLPLPETTRDNTLSWNIPGLELHVQLRPSGTLTSPLDLSDRSQVTPKDLQEAIRQRRTFAEATMGGKEPEEEAVTRIPLMALVEIDNGAEFKDSRADPKFAVRIGCASAGVVTQFIQTAITGNLKTSRTHRARMAWLDAFRQIGVSRVPRHTLTASLPSELQYVSVWMAKRRWDGPTRKSTWRLLALRVRPEDGVRAVCGWRHDIRRWVPYREYLLWLAGDVNSAEAANNQYGESLPEDDRHENQPEDWGSVSGHTEGTREERRRKTNALLRPLIAQLKGRPSLLMTHAQNLRDSWTWLRNGDLERDRIWLDDGEEGLPIHQWGRGLRLLRVRDSGGDETPQWYGTDGRHGLPPGIRPVLDGLDQRVFYSSADKALTARNSAIGAVKDGTRTNANGNVVSDTNTDANNPNLLEITVLARQKGEEPDVPKEWAACAHQLRYAPDIKAPLALPYPLHMAKLAVEYVLPTAEG